jgi:hypothetical protein
MFEFGGSRAKAAKLAKGLYPSLYGIIRLLRATLIRRFASLRELSLYLFFARGSPIA